MNMYTIESGQLKSDNTPVTEAEAEVFNKEVPDFFSEEYYKQLSIKQKNMAGIGFFATGFLLLLATRAYIWRYGNEK